MQRKNFIKSLAMAGIATGLGMEKLSSLNRLTDTLANSETMPLLFLGHGSPMNAIEENEFVRGFREVEKTIPRPAAILVISAHWETRGTFVTAMEKPITIHDFGGFPQALFDVQYPAPGSPELALQTKTLVKSTEIGLDTKWGLDHGAWSVVKHLYPLADIPVIQMSIDYTKPPQYHFELAQELAALRKKGVLIIGSGNMVHNLRMLAWDKMDADNFGFDWAIEASEKMKQYILSGDYAPLINFKSQGRSFDLAIPTPDHYIPLLYTLGLKDKNDNISLFNDKAVGGSLTMTSVKIEAAG
jgi:4,5-DOPA dioxygenase extradiol